MRTHRPLSIVILALIVVAACRQTKTIANNTVVSQPTPSPRPMLDAPEIPVNEFLRQQDQVKKDSQSALVRAWEKLPRWNNYRVARSTDFRVPEWVEKENDGRDIDRAINDPYVGGEMSGAEGLAVIIVDKTISDPKRFSCVVFISRAANRYDLFWIFKNEDLSHFTMGRHSGDVYLLELREDGTRHICDIQYSRQQKRWACELN